MPEICEVACMFNASIWLKVNHPMCKLIVTLTEDLTCFFTDTLRPAGALELLSIKIKSDSALMVQKDKPHAARDADARLISFDFVVVLL